LESLGGKRMTYDFQERLEFSQGARCETDAQTIMALLDGCKSVRVNESHGNDNGVDYIATLRKGSVVLIDAKTRERGCSRYWRNNQPELAIEKWSVIPGGKFNIPAQQAKAGWTIDESKATDMILYTFDKSDCRTAFLLPFQPLRMAARRMMNDWMGRFKVDTQTSGGWQSQAVFVPAYEVIRAMELTYSMEFTERETETQTMLFEP
jgi:hypothetical protein